MKRRDHGATMSTALLALMLLAGGCSRSNNLLLGRVEATMDGHPIVVTDCYRTSVPQPRATGDSSGPAEFRFTPFRDADVVIRGGELFVNGQSYGRLNPADRILVDHGAVAINK
jgi:hypothetical protein